MGVFTENNFSAFDLAIGLHYTWTGSHDQGFTIGMAVHHLTNPDFSFLIFSLPSGIELLKKHPLYGLKSILHASGSFRLSESQIVIPRMWILSQGLIFKIKPGCIIKNSSDRDGYKNFNVGGFLRSVKNSTGLLPESLIPMLGPWVGECQFLTKLWC